MVALVWAEAFWSYSILLWLNPFVPRPQAPKPQLLPLWALDSLAPGLVSSGLVPQSLLSSISVLFQAIKVFLQGMGYCTHTALQVTVLGRALS